MLKIIDYAWHQVHLYRLHALPAEFTLLDLRRHSWNEYQRPKPANFKGVIQESEFKAQDYDLALLHLDQWCDTDHYRALPFREMQRITRGMQQICIMHGTPDSLVNRLKILQLIGDLPVVCNSYQAAREWDGGEGRLDRYGLPQFRTIVHGYAVDEFYNYPLEQRNLEAITVCSGGSISKYYHGVPLIERLRRDVPLFWYGIPEQGADREWADNYAGYRDLLAQALIYFSPTRRGPMPGARTEAMLSGCCIVSVPGNDWENYIVDGVNGYIVENYFQAREVIKGMLARPDIAYQVGQKGRQYARDQFNHDRYVKEWLQLLTQMEV